MDYQQLIQRNITKITIGIAVVGVTTFTIWYYNSRQTEHEAYIQTDDSNATEISMPRTRTINPINTEQVEEPSNSFANHNPDNNQSTIKTIDSSAVSMNGMNGLHETETFEQINVASHNTMDSQTTNNDKANKHTMDEIINNDMKNMKHENSELIIKENTETQTEEKTKDDYHEIDEISVSEYKAKHNSENSLKIKLDHTQHSDDEYKYNEADILEIHARNEKISKQDRKVGRLNKDSFTFIKDGDVDSTERGSNTPRKEIKEDTSWLKQRDATSSPVHVVHPSIMMLNLNKLVSDARIIKELSPISDETESLFSMKTTKRGSTKSKESPQKQ